MRLTFALLALSGCALVEPIGPDEASAAFVDARWEGAILSAARSYGGWGAIDGEARWAPGLCAMPAPAHLHHSDADAARHSEKLFLLYALDPVAYGSTPGMYGSTRGLEGVQQVVIKESFAPRRVDPEKGPVGQKLEDFGGRHAGVWARAVDRDGTTYEAGEFLGLYMMLKVGPEHEHTDAGWIYATVEPDLKTISAAGVLTACAQCHREAPHGRLFGIDSPLVDRAGIKG